MSFLRTMIFATAFVLLVVSALAQDPNVKHFDKDGLSFDYPAKWQIADKSSGQMQFLELEQGDVVIRVRAPREWLKTPEKEAHAKKLFQDQYVDEFSTQLEGAGLHPKRSTVATQIGEVVFVKNHRACPDQFLALEVAVHIRREVFILHHRIESLLDRVECFDRSCVVVLVMRPDKLL